MHPLIKPIIQDKPKEAGMVGLTINYVGSGESITYACGGVHVSNEQRKYLPEGRRKLFPGDVVYFPKDLAEELMDTGLVRRV